MAKTLWSFGRSECSRVIKLPGALCIFSICLYYQYLEFMVLMSVQCNLNAGCLFSNIIIYPQNNTIWIAPDCSKINAHDILSEVTLFCN